MLLRRTLLALSTILLGMVARATHISGGEIYYDCIGNGQYRITLVVYRDCRGINLNNSYTLNLNSPCGNRTLTVSTPGGTEISQLCDLQLPNSTCSGGDLPGIQQYIYTGVISLPPCDSWTISWTEPWRNEAIANLQNPGNKNVYVQAVMNNQAGPCNDSPQFTNTAIPYVCAGFPVSYSYGAFDPEGDSLSYSFISAMNTGGVALPYTAGFSGTQPITGITLDPLTGQVNFTLNQIGNWVVVVRVNQYDANGVLVGSVMRDMQFVAYPCSNTPPDPTTGLVSNLDGTSSQTGPRAVEICESGDFCFDMVISDPDAGDILEATSNITQNLPGATFSFTGTNPITCHVCWTGTPGASGFFPFIVTANDGACPIPALQTYVYSIHVLPGLQVSGTVVDEGCAGDGDGTATVSVDVGLAPFTYAWSNGGTDPSITAGAGSYDVTVTDANGCISQPWTAVIGSQGQPNEAHAGADLIGCFGELPVALHGTVTNATGGTWSGGSGTFTGGGLNATYMPTMAEVNGGGVDLYLTTTGNSVCPPDKDTVHVTLPSSFFGSSISHTDLLCRGDADGTATYLPDDPGFSFLWDDPAAQTAHIATGLFAGVHSLQVTDSYGCDTTLSVTITEPPALLITNMSVVHEQCAGNGDGSITATVSGGTAPYHYSWSNGDTTQTITVGAGDYTVTVTDANGCTGAQANATVVALGQPNEADAGADLIGCFGELPVSLSGSVTHAISGIWSGGAGTFMGSGLNVTYMPTMAEVNSGGVDLYLTTTGNTTCPADRDTVHVTLPSSFFHSSITGTDALCNGTSTGSATFLPSEDLSFLWSDPAAQTTSTATGLAAGNYSVYVTDSYGCDTTVNVTIGQPAAITIADLTVVDEQCGTSNDGTVTVTAAGGTAPYHYSWSNGDTTAMITVGAGDYTVTVTDANHCAFAQATGTVHALGQPNEANAGADLIGCFGSLPVELEGSVVNATGGTWSGGSGVFTGSGLNVTYMPTMAEVNSGGVDLYLTTTGNVTCPADRDTVHVTLPSSFFQASIAGTDALCNGTSTGSATFLPNEGLSFLWSDPAAQTTATATGLAAGLYSIQVTDGYGCDTTLSVTIGQPAAITIADLAVVDEQCAGNHDGTVTVTAAGGTAPYHYSWSNGDTTRTITVGAGDYTVTVTDANHCAVTQGTATVHALGQPNEANAGADLIGCFGSLPVELEGSVVHATGGTWSGGNGTFAGSGLSATYMPTMAEVNSGGVDLYLTTTGNVTCPADRDTVHVTLPSTFFPATISATTVDCAGASTGTATFLPNDAGLTYLWSDAAAQTASTATGLPTGTYSVHVTDSYGCDTTASVFVPEPLPLTITGITTVAPTCAGYSNGSATVSVAGGTPSYAYAWSANTGGQITPTATGLPSGAYVVTVTDAHGCTAQSGTPIFSPSPITLSAQVDDTVCVNVPTPLTAQAGGGTGDHVINWAGIGTGDTLDYSFPASQVVTVSVTDAAGCVGPTVTLPVTVLDLSLATLNTYGDTTLCPGSTATVGAWVSGYPSTTTLDWPDLPGTGIGPFALVMQQDRTLTVTATDVCGNHLQATIPIDVQTPPEIALPPIIAEDCAPVTAHFPTGLTSQQVTYLWDFGDGTTSTAPAPVHVYPAGAYTVSLTVTTPLGCVGHAATAGQVIAHALPVAAFTADPWHTDMNAPQVHFTDQSTGTVSSYSWTFGDQGSSEQPDPSHTYDAPGIYAVQLVVEDAFGCSSTVTHNVQIDPDYDITVPNAFTPDPNGGGGGTYNPFDLSNDVFYPFIRFAKDYRMRIFNRWGELVFETNDLKQGWDGYYRGQISQQDVYVYQVWVRFVDNKEMEKMGDLTLFR